MLQKLWSWTVVGAVVLCFVGGGISFTTSGYPWVADGFYLVAGLLFLVKFLTWEEGRQQDLKRRLMMDLGTSVLAVCMVGLACWGNHKLNSRPQAPTKEDIAEEVWRRAPVAAPAPNVSTENKALRPTPLPNEKLRSRIDITYSEALVMHNRLDNSVSLSVSVYFTNSGNLPAIGATRSSLLGLCAGI